MTRPWSVRARAHTHAHRHTNTHTNAAFIQFTEMMPPQQSQRAQLFPSSCRIGQRTEKLHSPRTHARARNRRAVHERSARVLSTQKYTFRLHLFAQICEMRRWKTEDSLALNVQLLQILRPRRARLCASVRSRQSVRQKQGSSSSTASLSIHWAHITSRAPKCIPSAST